MTNEYLLVSLVSITKIKIFGKFAILQPKI